MSHATIQACALIGIDVVPVVVEAHLAGGLPGMSIVGLPQSTVRESKDRVKAAIQNSDFRFPLARVVINLAPADLPKRGGRFDLPIALAVLMASGQLDSTNTSEMVVIGELGLSGDLRGVSGVLPTAHALAERGATLLLPRANAEEASLCRHGRRLLAGSLIESVELLSHDMDRSRQVKSEQDRSGQGTSGQGTSGQGRSGQDRSGNGRSEQGGSGNGRSGCGGPGTAWPGNGRQARDGVRVTRASRLTGIAAASKGPDLADVRGQAMARRALEIAAAGRHHLLLTGPPGTGKSMLAARLPTLLPPMLEQEALEAASVTSVSHQGFEARNWGHRPFRSPHHTASGVALVGGGVQPAPGEISLSHAGVLFLDELPEFPRRVLDVLREPLESGRIVISRGVRQAEFPARCQLVAAMNPCPCGFDGEVDVTGQRRCRCQPEAIERYRSRISGPLLDRIDLVVPVRREPLTSHSYRKGGAGESSATVRERILCAVDRQWQRQDCLNADLDPSTLDRVATLPLDGQQLLEQAAEQLQLSIRASHRVLCVARTLADLAGAHEVSASHVAEALSYRVSSVGLHN